MPVKRLNSQIVTRAWVLGVVAVALLVAGCEPPPEYSGEGGILDSPVSVAVYGEYAYVTNGNFDMSGDKDGWVAVIDIAKSLRNRKQCIVFRLRTDPYLGDILITKDGLLAYVANRKRDEIFLMDISDPARPSWIDLDPDKGGDQGIDVGRAPVGMALTPDESLLLVANVGSGDLSLVDTEKRRTIKNIRLSGGISQVEVDPEGKYAYVTNKGINSISMIDIETGKFVTSFAVGNPRSGLGQDTRGIAFSANGDYAYIAAGQPASLMVVDTKKLPYYPESAVVEYIPMDSQPTAVTPSPDGSEIWVANYNSSNIYVIDSTYHNITDVLDSGIGPYDIAFTENPNLPGHYYAYVVNFLIHNVTLYDATTKDLIWAIP